jgi:putative protease
MEKEIGQITHYYNRIAVAVLNLQEGLKIGDDIHIVGHTTDFTQRIESLEINHRQVQSVGAGADVALAVDGRVRRGDKVYLVGGKFTPF